MRELILFDIDGTLFNPEVFGKEIRARFCEILNVEEDALMRANADYYAGLETTTDFNPHDIAAFLAGRFNADSSLLDKVFWDEDEIYKKSLFEETEEILEKLSSKATLGIYSQGFEELQKRKLAASGIDKYFDKNYMFFERRKMSDDAISLLPREATVIEDKHDVVAKIAPYVSAIWLNRRTADPDPQFRTIHNLRELLT